ncbi:MAG: VOC family protein [Pseudomonadota bacterium]
MVDRFLTNIMTEDVAATRDFYVTALGLSVHFDSDWYVILTPQDGPRFELGIISKGSDVVPEAFRALPQGVYLTFVVADVDEAAARIQNAGIALVEPPTDTFYGQRRLLVQDPNGLLVDISSPTPRG